MTAVHTRHPTPEPKTMTTTTEQLAEALRAAEETIQAIRTCAEYEAHTITREHDSDRSRAALARYDADRATQTGDDRLLIDLATPLNGEQAAHALDLYYADQRTRTE